MFIRPTQIEDLDAAMALYDHARQYMRQNGNDQQWGGGYPSRELVTEDITKGQSYLCCDDNGTPLAVFCFTVGEEPTYRKIYQGTWLDEKPYGVIHRLGVGAHRGGVCSFLSGVVLAAAPQPPRRHPSHQSAHAGLPCQKRLSSVRHHLPGRWRRAAGIS